MEAWETLLSGGAGYDHLDWSFTPGDPTGAGKSPIGDGRRLASRPLRKQLGELAALWREAGPARMQPDDRLLVSTPPNTMAFASSRDDRKLHVVYMADTRANKAGFGAPLSGKLTLRMAKGAYRARSLSCTGLQDKVTVSADTVTMVLPEFRHDCAIVLTRE